MNGSSTLWQRQPVWGIKAWELTAYVGVHFLFGLLYFITLLLAVKQNQIESVVINYAYKILVTIPFWWIFFRGMRRLPLAKKIWLHLPASALYVVTWLGLFYTTLDFLGIGRLRGQGIWWDVYIPLLGYFIQFGIFHAYFYWTETIEQQKKEKHLMKLAHTAELNTLKAQIQPHFLFNTLNSISSSLTPPAERSRMLIAQLADIFRFAMNVTDRDTVNLQDELAFIKNYLALEQHRFGDRLEVEYRIDERLHDYQLPPMLLQPLIENALKHGIAKSVEGGRIVIAIQKVAGAIQFAVSDTGHGINGMPVTEIFNKGIGLENTRQRLLRLYNSSLQIVTSEQKGFTVRFTLPLQNHGAWN